MTILNAMYSGVSGLSAEGEALGVVGDNVSNSSTVGFKQSRAIFEDALASAVGSTNATGAGVRIARVQQIFAQGTLLNTGQATDIALSGDGFFVTNGTLNGITGNFYTRAGQTTLRQDGTLVHASGLPLLGYPAMPGGQFSPQLGPIVVPTAALQPKPTTTLTITANLDANAAPPINPWDPQNPSASSNYSTSMRIYDSLGNAHSVDMYFRKTGNNTWEYHALAAGAQIQGGVPGQNVEIATGNLTFNPSGALQTSAVVAGGTASFIGAAPNQALTFDLGTPIAAGGTGLGGTTQFGSPSNVSSQSQDGYSSGDLGGVKIESDGTVKGIYSNGEQVAVGRLAVAKFRANDGLGRAGHNLWVATRESGEAALAEAGAGGRGAIVAGSLEQSNVDLATQFVELIAHQRAFQANSKTITTANEMMQEIVNLKR